MATKNSLVTIGISIFNGLFYLGLILGGLAIILIGWVFLWWWLAILATVVGGILSVGGAAWAIVGTKNFDADQYKGGVLTVFGRIFTWGAGCNTFTFKGVTPLVPPIIGAFEVDLKSDHWVFDVEVSSVEKEIDSQTGKPRELRVKGKIEMMATPDVSDMDDFRKIGGMPGAKSQSEGIAFREVQKAIVIIDGGMPMTEIVQRGELLSNWLEARLNGTANVMGIFEQKSFGVTVDRIQVQFFISQAISDAMNDSKIASLEVNAQRIRTEGDVNNALAIKEVGAEAWDRMIQAEQLRQGVLRRFQVHQIASGGTEDPATMTINNLHFDMSEGGKGKSK
jgi:hypothetical protein